MILTTEGKYEVDEQDKNIEQIKLIEQIEGDKQGEWDEQMKVYC